MVLEPGHSGFVDITPLQTDAGDPESLQLFVYSDPEDTAEDVHVVSPDEGLVGLEWIDVTERTERWISVRTLNGVEGNYQLSHYDFPPCPQGNDRFEENNSIPLAAALDAAEQPFRHLRLCDGDEDWYRVTLPQDPPDDEADGDPADPNDPNAAPSEPEPEAFSALAAYREPGRFISVDIHDSATLALMARGIPEWAARANYDPERAPPVPNATPLPPAPGTGAQPQGPGIGVPPGTGTPPPMPEPLRPTEPPADGSALAVAAATQLEPETADVLVRVAGEPGFYHLAFPDTESQQQQSQSSESSDERRRLRRLRVRGSVRGRPRKRG